MSLWAWLRSRWLVPVAEDRTLTLALLVFRRMRVLLGLSILLNALLLWAWATRGRVVVRTRAVVHHAASLGEVALRFEETYAAQLDDLLAAQAAFQDALSQTGPGNANGRTKARARYLEAVDRFNARSETLVQIRNRLRRDAGLLQNLVKEGTP